MGKEGELWDDSALIKAFDDALSKYKRMHGKGAKEKSNGVSFAGVAKSGSEDAFPASNANNDDNSLLETENEGLNDDSRTSVDVAEAEVNDTGYAVDALKAPEEQVQGSTNLPIQNGPQDNSCFLAADEYNQLYKQYYELEEQRQQILQKLQNFSGWSYTGGVEASGSGVQWGTTATQEYQSAMSQAPCGTILVSCCPCACPCSMASCSSMPCPLPGACTSTLCNDASASMGLEKQPAVEDTEIVKMAMGAAERAISTLKETYSDRNRDSKICGGTETNSGHETDLSSLLNAWYSAGFYTGRYLTEQFAKKRHD